MFQISEFHRVSGLLKKEMIFLNIQSNFQDHTNNKFFQMAILNFLRWQAPPYPLFFDGLP